MKIVRQASLAATPWKNGGGLTREAIRVPASGEPFAWRVSFAQIDRSGPFSDFSGYVRHMVLLRGAGVRLEFADGGMATLREVGDSIRFDGAVATSCELLQGSCVDLNLIASAARYSVDARVERVREPLTWQAQSRQSLLIVPIDAAVVVQDMRGMRTRLESWDLAVGSGTEHGISKLSLADQQAPCRVFLARIVDNDAADRQ
ncbi:MAG: HutD family protein [Steroidobacterales bacterium]